MSKIKYGIQPVSPKTATYHIKRAYTQISHDLLGVHEPFLIHSPSENVLLGLWAVYRESLLARGIVSRELKESITVTISQINQCPWCFEAHQISLHAVGASDTVTAITKPNQSSQLDAKTSAIIEWARATKTPNAKILAIPPFSLSEAPEIIGTALLYHYITRMVNALLVESALPPYMWLKEPLKRFLGVIFKPYANKKIPQGETLEFLPESPLPSDFEWAKNHPTIGGAFARFITVMEIVGAQTLPIEVREVVQSYVNTWQGQDPSMSRGWVDTVIQSLGANMQPLAKLTLLGAIAPYQIGESVIDAFREILPSDYDLVQALAWGSFIATRKIASWIVPSQL